jgi:hypothetical protein
MDNLVPGGFKALDEAQMKLECKKLAQMKIVSKIARNYRFDYEAFVKTLDINEND